MTASEYFKKEYGNNHIESTVKMNDLISLFSLMDEHGVFCYNQALGDLMNEVEKSSFSGDMKETIRQMVEILKK